MKIPAIGTLTLLTCLVVKAAERAPETKTGDEWSHLYLCASVKEPTKRSRLLVSRNMNYIYFMSNVDVMYGVPRYYYQGNGWPLNQSEVPLVNGRYVYGGYLTGGEAPQGNQAQIFVDQNLYLSGKAFVTILLSKDDPSGNFTVPDPSRTDELKCEYVVKEAYMK